MTKYLDSTGLQKLIEKVVKYVKAAIAAIPNVTTSVAGLMSAEDKTKLDGVAAGAQVNVIESVSVNGSALTITSKGVDVTVPTDLNDLSNLTTDFQSGSQVDSKIAAAISSTYKPAGSLAASGISNSLLVAANEGKVYNITEQFTTTADFVEGASKKYEAGTNIVVINAGTGQTPSWKFDILAGFIDVAGLSTEGLSESDINSAWTAAEAAVAAEEAAAEAGE